MQILCVPNKFTEIRRHKQLKFKLCYIYNSSKPGAQVDFLDKFE